MRSVVPDVPAQEYMPGQVVKCSRRFVLDQRRGDADAARGGRLAVTQQRWGVGKRGRSRPGSWSRYMFRTVPLHDLYPRVKEPYWPAVARTRIAARVTAALPLSLLILDVGTEHVNGLREVPNVAEARKCSKISTTTPVAFRGLPVGVSARSVLSIIPIGNEAVGPWFAASVRECQSTASARDQSIAGAANNT